MKNVKHVVCSLALALSAISSHAAFAGDARQESRQERGSIVDVARAAGKFSTLLTALDAAGLTATVATTPNLTVFAPTDAAFAALPAGALQGLLADTAALKNVLLYHVLTSKVPASAAVQLTEAKMANGSTIKLRFDGTTLFVNDAKVVIKDIPADNGLIHVIDGVLLPE